MAGNLVLVVDDDLLLHVVLEHKLVDAGFRVRTATDAEGALEIMEQERPAIIVLDVIMSSMNGFDLLRRLKADAARRDIPVVMLTGSAGERDVVEAFRLGAADFLTKPFIPDELVERLLRLPTAELTA